MTPHWLQDAVIYQIYPQSFQDSNADGIGDFQGIISRLDYVKSIGVNLIWLNPCFDSPFNDAGYDVRDYYKTAPRYGTNNDLAKLFAVARETGIRVILDLVVGHTAIDHQWFIKSAQPEQNDYSDRYIWKNRDFDPVAGPTAANYLHNFFTCQPALNFGYAEIDAPWQDSIDAPGPQKNIQELKKIMAFWLDMGCSGFRVDMAASLVKNDPQRLETINLWKNIRTWYDEFYPEAILVAEWSNPAESITAGFHLDFLMHFNIDIYKSLFFNGNGTLPPDPYKYCYFAADGNGTPWDFLPEYQRQLKAIDGLGFISLPTANHDFQRLNCQPRMHEAEWRNAWVFLMTQMGIPTIYYGDEIGMRHVDSSPPKEGSTLNGVTAPNAGSAGGERAGTRTPMQWDNSPNAGFSTASPEELYLPLDSNENRPTVANQEKSSNSMLNFVRRLLELRRRHPALGPRGALTILTDESCNYPLIYSRSLANSTYIIAINPSARAVSAKISPAYQNFTELLQSGLTIKDSAKEFTTIKLQPYGYGILKTIFTSIHIASK
jgi:maltose alpha-D-glucosyltransferase/alpha-amylase